MHILTFATVVLIAASTAGAPRPAAPPMVLVRADTETLAAVLDTAPGARPRLIHVWASWCVPCVAEWPALAERFRRWSKYPLDIVSLALEEEDAAAAGAVLAKAGAFPGRALWTNFDGAVPAIRKLDPEWDGALPTTFLVDARGALVLAQRGVTRFSTLDQEVARWCSPGSLDAKKPSAAPGRDHEEAP